MSPANGRGSEFQMAKRRAASQDVCPLEVKSLRTDKDTRISSLDRETPTKSSTENQQEEEGTAVAGGDKEDRMEEELGWLDMDLLRKSKQHNLTSNNVRAILHEVITHEHVVSMMKAAIRDTQDQPMFEPKMTRSRLKQAGRSSQLPSWSLALDRLKHPQFVDIDLNDDEDSSDEEYCPDEDEEEDEEDTAEESRLQAQTMGISVPEDLLAAPQDLLTAPDSSFLDRLNAVDEELNCSSPYTFNQKAADDGAAGGDTGCLACRTRSKRPLVNIPLGQLEAELLAPDITADMYEQSATQREEDRHWARWLQGLMDPENLEEADDDDDPEYNFVDDLDEPDQEDYRTDRAVQITRKEVNELLEELFQTLQEETQQQDEEEEEEEEEEDEAPSQAGPNFNTPQAICFQMPLAESLTEQRRPVRTPCESVQQRRALQDMTNQDQGSASLKQISAMAPGLMRPGPQVPSLHLKPVQRLQLQQQIQQHVQLLTQAHLLCRNQDNLKHEASTTKQYLEELFHFSRTQEALVSRSSFRVCNLQTALDLLQEVEQKAAPAPVPRAAASSKGWLPRMAPATNSHAFPLLPVEDAWLFATRSIFLYPEILPVCSLDKKPNHRVIYTPGENGLLVLALKHFEGTLGTEQLISSYLLCKSRCSIRKHIREMSMSKVSPGNVIKTFRMEGVVQLPPLSCSSVQPGEQRPPVDRVTAQSPKWLKNSQLNIQKTRLSSSCYPPSLPPGCSLRLHPHFVSKARPPMSAHCRIFTLAHNASLLPLAKAPAERSGQSAVPQPVPADAGRDTSSSHVLTPHGHADTLHSDFSHQQVTSSPQNHEPAPSMHIQASSDCTSPLLPVGATSERPGSFLLPVTWTPPTPPTTAYSSTIQRPEQQIQSLSTGRHVSTQPWSSEKECSRTPSAESPQSVQQEENPEDQHHPTTVGVTSLNGGGNTGRQEQEGSDGERIDGGGHEEPEEVRGDGKRGGEEEERDNGGGEGEEDGEKDKNEDQDKDDDQEEEEEDEEDFDDLTQDEDDEEVMSSASEESVLSVPELQETMKQLTWLAAERRHCTDGDSEEEHSPTSPGSQEEEEEDDEEGPKGQEEEVEEERSRKETGRSVLSVEGPPGGGGGRCSARGRGRGRPLRGLRRSRQERHSKDATKLLLLYDDHILDNDPFRESKDLAFAQSYLRRVREALQDDPVQVEDFVSLLHGFEQLGESQEVMPLFRKLCSILGNRSDLLRDFAAFLHPEQALQCGLFEEQQAFERSRRFLRQLEISFGDNPSHYQKIIKALQTSPDLNPAGIDELKAQMGTLLKGHTHLQTEFWVFFEELHPPTAHPGQFEESHWPEGGDSQVGGGQASAGFEEVSLPDVDEEEEGHKIQPMTRLRQRRKMGTHKNYKTSSGTGSRAIKGLDPVDSQLNCGHSEAGDKDQDVKGDAPGPGLGLTSRVLAERSRASWESATLTDEKEEEDLEKEQEEERKKGRLLISSYATVTQLSLASSSSLSLPASSAPPPDLPVCAKNISLTASGKKVILWTRDADRVILTRCQQDGANQNTFQAISALLGNKTPSEVFRRFQDLMGLFRTAARQSSSEEEAPPTDVKAAADGDG